MLLLLQQLCKIFQIYVRKIVRNIFSRCFNFGSITLTLFNISWKCSAYPNISIYEILYGNITCIFQAIYIYIYVYIYMHGLPFIMRYIETPLEHCFHECEGLVPINGGIVIFYIKLDRYRNMYTLDVRMYTWWIHYTHMRTSTGHRQLISSRCYNIYVYCRSAAEMPVRHYSSAFRQTTLWK